MGWRDYLMDEPEQVVFPWVGGRQLFEDHRVLTIFGELPKEHGWHAFAVEGRQVRWQGEAMPEPNRFVERFEGYLCGDRLVPDGVRVGHDMAELGRRCPPVFLVEPGLDRFTRVAAGRITGDGPLVYDGPAFPLGPEAEVLDAYLDGLDDVDHVPAVVPALDAVFRIERWREKEAERLRRELEEQRRKQAEEEAREERRRQLVARLGDGALRREAAKLDFTEAARAALAIGGAELLDARAGYHAAEMIVRFRYFGGRYECTCDRDTLRIIDAGICLVDHATGIKGDTRFTLESLPGVIGQASREGALVVFR
ncbi:MAG: hypothetical protein KC731_38785 [Myxococcales bacterium]|nr:hypothetical protein [Myxococcales bacterium]